MNNTMRTLIVDYLELFPDGVTVDEVRAHFDNVPSRNEVTIWLLALLNEGAVVRAESAPNRLVPGGFSPGPRRRRRFRLT